MIPVSIIVIKTTPKISIISETLNSTRPSIPTIKLTAMPTLNVNKLSLNSSASQHNVSQREDWRQLDDIAFNIETYYLWVILAIGFPANCSTIITIIKMSPARSLTIYIALLAIVDNLAIVNKLLMFVLTDHGVPIGAFGCKFLGFLGNYLITFANWLLVAMSAERFVAVWYPFKLGQVWTFKKSLMTVLVIALTLFGIFVHLFWTMDYRYDVETQYPVCLIKPKYAGFMMSVWFWLNIIIYALLPCFLLIIFNGLIVTGIIRSSRIHKIITQNGVQDGNSIAQDRQRQTTLMLVAAAVGLVVLTTPRCVMLIMSPYQKAHNESMKGATLYLIDTVAYVLCDSTHAINFYLYSFSARRFRMQFLELILCRKTKPTHANSNYITLTFRPSVRSNIPADQDHRKKQVTCQ